MQAASCHGNIAHGRIVLSILLAEGHVIYNVRQYRPRQNISQFLAAGRNLIATNCCTKQLVSDNILAVRIPAFSPCRISKVSNSINPAIGNIIQIKLGTIRNLQDITGQCSTAIEILGINHEQGIISKLSSIQSCRRACHIHSTAINPDAACSSNSHRFTQVEGGSSIVLTPLKAGSIKGINRFKSISSPQTGQGIAAYSQAEAHI